MRTLKAFEFIVFLPLVIYKKYGVAGSLLVAYLTASVTAPFVQFFNKYVFNDWDFFRYFVVALTVDLASGIVKNWLNKSICWEDGLIKFARKTFTCLAIMVIFHVFINFEDGTASDIARQYFDIIKRLMILSFIGLSAIVNIYEISGGKFPPLWLISRMKDFDDEGRKMVPANVKQTTTSTEIKQETIIVKQPDP